MTGEDKIKLDQDFYDDLRSGNYVKVFVNDIQIKSKYVYSQTTEHFLKILMGRFEQKKGEDIVTVRIKFGAIEQEINLTGHFRIIEAEGWK